MAPRDYAGAASPEREALLHHPEASLYVPLEQRKRQDGLWAILWTVLYIGNLVAGVLTFLNRNVEFATQMTPEYLNDPDHCPAAKNLPSRSLLSMRATDEGSDVAAFDKFMKHALLWLLISAAGALVLGMLFVVLVSRSPRVLLYIAVGIQVGLPLAAGTTLLAYGGVGPSIPFFIWAGALILLFYLWRQQLNLVVQLMGISGQGLRENLGLIGTSILIQLVLAVMTIPLYLALVSAVTNGHVVANSDRVGIKDGTCVDKDDQNVLCCAWQMDNHVGPIIAVTLFTVLWTSFIFNEIKTFTVSGTIAQWYFAPVFADPKTNKGRIGRSLKAALGPSFGSLCFGALVLTAISMMRSALEELKKQAKKNVFLYCLVVMFQYLLIIVELITKFATVNLAITGQSFMDAGRSVTAMLKRNFMDTFGVWYLPPLILNMSALAIAVIWGVFIFFVSANTYSDMQMGTSYATVLAILAFVPCFIILSFFISLLLNIIDAVFICYGLDRDRQTCSRVEVHQVYSQLPSVSVVQNPDQTYAYAATPSAPPQPYRM